MTPEERARKISKEWFDRKRPDGMYFRETLETSISEAIREAEQSAFERAAAFADKIAQDELKRRDGAEDEDFVSRVESRCVIAAFIAQSIRALGKQEA